MSGLKIIRGINEIEAELVTSSLKAFNDSSHPLFHARRQNPDDPMPLQVVAHDDQGRVIGGILAKAWLAWKWLDIEIVWVDQSYRNQGLGSKLLREIEQMGIENGCVKSKLTSLSFQAPDFYIKHGYQIYGELQNFLDGVTDYFLWKSLQTP